ncbi:hypothetical protein DSCO28_04990 [Desulfosarcina ovata subsp. sediminis]|uniref:CRISPR type III-associated protein domain-containing protein n=1 Tax=Desulfosarcina ovata subsp. sediminis TaxID=885957 RepID=A0A5K7ZQT5_9BACT|nr:type III-B CRISPR module RAMP protein Cmr1 [Desulfosarcina ovata]BBO79933.1 hypothetical protein DSCO28_04990 [Desulfosarcina ovata subsp. sediminis]
MPEKRRLTAKYEIATPMFIGDANQNAKMVSPSSVKGALRFWWRALHWSEFRNNANSDVDALISLHNKESSLFGRESKVVKNKQLGGQGKFLLRVKTKNIQCKSIADLNQDSPYSLGILSWQSYLLGLGLMEYDRDSKRNKYHRSAIISGSFSVELYFRDKDAIDELKPVLLTWGMLGGLGSRNRKGLGSVNIVSLNGENIPDDRDTYIKYLKQIIKPNSFRDELPPYTAFSKKVKVLVSPEKYSSTWEALGSVGETMQKFRGWGYQNPRDNVHYIRPKVKAIHDSYTNKENDHNLVYQIATGNAPKKYPKSIVFGLPKMYNLSRAGEVKLEPEARDNDGQPDQNNKRSRRASPLFIHIHMFDQKAFIVQVFLPATFLPKNDVIPLGDDVDAKLQKPTDWVAMDEYIAQSDFKGWEVKLWEKNISTLP